MGSFFLYFYYCFLVIVVSSTALIGRLIVRFNTEKQEENKESIVCILTLMASSRHDLHVAMGSSRIWAVKRGRVLTQGSGMTDEKMLCMILYHVYTSAESRAVEHRTRVAEFTSSMPTTRRRPRGHNTRPLSRDVNESSPSNSRGSWHPLEVIYSYTFSGVSAWLRVSLSSPGQIHTPAYYAPASEGRCSLPASAFAF
jgi:hypothetical protein